jgi:hypothetical protein
MRYFDAGRPTGQTRPIKADHRRGWITVPAVVITEANGWRPAVCLRHDLRADSSVNPWLDNLSGAIFSWQVKQSRVLAWRVCSDCRRESGGAGPRSCCGF